MSDFVGRSAELRSLDRLLAEVKAGIGTGRPGRCLLVRGRRRVGKSRLLEEFCERAGVPSLFFTASRQGSAEIQLFVDEIASSGLPGRDAVVETRPATWDAALRLLGAALDPVGPAVVVIDEFPYLAADDPTIEATLQKQWDRTLSRLPVLLVLVGSDLAMMEALGTHGRPFFQRGTELVVPPLGPAEVGRLTGAPDAAAALDAYLVTGGLPLLCRAWPAGASLWDHLAGALDEPTSPLIVSAERTLAAEFPGEALARDVLGRIGAGEASFTSISRAGGGLQAASLNRALAALTGKRLVARELPLSTRPSREARYRISDPYLRFWLRFVGPRLPLIERGRGDRVLDAVRQGWTTWRGKAIEPVVREALARLSPLPGLPEAPVVGGYWTRTNVPEIDLIGADTAPVATAVRFAGSVKWLARPFDAADARRLAADAAAVPGVDAGTPLVAVSRAGVEAPGVVALGPDDVLAAWP